MFDMFKIQFKGIICVEVEDCCKDGGGVISDELGECVRQRSSEKQS